MIKNMPVLNKQEITNFWNMVEETDSCWLWIGYVERHGYARFQVQRKRFNVHRISYYLHYKTDPGASYVCHSCDNPRCVNPEHLWLGTSRDNTHDALSKFRLNHGERHYLSKLTDKKVLEIRELRSRGLTLSSIAKKYSVHPSLIHLVAARKNWKHVL